jgi:uncharacterized repeat protein (TIGR03803 family)
LKHKGSGWTFNPLFSFNGSDGANPEARVIFGPNGTLYGTTTNGGGIGFGTVFNLRPQARACVSTICPWSETLLYSFAGYPDAANPGYGDLLFDQSGNGNIYGTTTEGGDNSIGVVYQLTPKGSGYTEGRLSNSQAMTGGTPTTA